MDRGAAYRESAADVGSRWSGGVPEVARVLSDGWLLLGRGRGRRDGGRRGRRAGR